MKYDPDPDLTLCINCGFYCNDEWENHACHHPNNLGKNPVDGSVSTCNTPWCLRENGDKCAKDAFWFEPKMEVELDKEEAEGEAQE